MSDSSVSFTGRTVAENDLAVVTVFAGMWRPATRSHGNRELQEGISACYWLVDEPTCRVLRVLVAGAWEPIEAGMTVVTMEILAEIDAWRCSVANLDEGRGSPALPLQGETDSGVVARVATLTGRGDAEARRYHHERILPALRAQAGYRGGLWLVDQAGGTRHNFSFWTSERGLRAATEQIYAGYRAAGRANPIEDEEVYQVADVL